MAAVAFPCAIALRGPHTQEEHIPPMGHLGPLLQKRFTSPFAKNSTSHLPFSPPLSLRFSTPAVHVPMTPSRSKVRFLQLAQCSAHYAASPPASTDQGNVDKLIAHLHYNLKEYSKSVEDVLEALKQSPRDVELYLLLSDAYAHLGLRNKAAQARRTAVQLEPLEDNSTSSSSSSSSSFARLALDAARLAMEQGRWVEAVTCAEGALEDSDSPMLLAELYKIISSAHKEMGDAEVALEAQRLAVAACPEDKSCRILLQLREVESAALHCAVEGNAHTPLHEAEGNSHISLYESGGKAHTSLYEDGGKTHTSLHGSEGIAHTSFYEDEGSTDTSLYHEGGGKTHTSLYEGSTDTSLCYEGGGKTVTSLNEAEGSTGTSLYEVCVLASQGIQLCWDCRCFECLPDFHRARGAALLKQGNAEAALEDFSEYQRLRPEEAEPYVLMSHVYHSLERLKASVEALEMAVKMDPGNEDAKILLASRLAELLNGATGAESCSISQCRLQIS